MRVEARYCDHCGIKIVMDDLSSGEAIQLDDSVFHCKECKEKLGSKSREELAPAKKAEAKALTSSRRLLTRRIQSGRLARSKAKVPAALTSSNDGDKNGAPALSEGGKKKAAADRAKTRDKLDKKKHASSTGKVQSIEAKKSDVDSKKSDVDSKKSDADLPVGAKKKDKSKKKKKKHKDGAAVAEKGEKAEKHDKVEKAEKADKTDKADKADETSARRKIEKAEKVEKADETSAKRKSDISKEAKVKAAAPAEAVSEAKADKTDADASSPEVAKVEPASEPASSTSDGPKAEKAVDSDEAPAKSEKADEPVVAEKPSKATRSEKVARAEKAPDILTTDSPPSSLTDSPPETTGSAVEDILSEVTESEAKAEKAEKAKAEKTKGKKADAEEADEDEDKASLKASKKKHDKGDDEGKKTKPEKDKKSAKDDDDDGDAEAAAARPSKLGTPSGKTPRKAARDDANDETSAAKKKEKKKSGGGTAVAEAEVDESAERKKLAKGKPKKLGRDSTEVAAAPAPKKGLPKVALVGAGIVLVGIIAAVGIVGSGGGGGPKIPPFDRTALFDDLKKYADDHPNDHEEVVARWEGLRDVLEGDLAAKASDEITQVEQRFQSQSRSAVDDLDGKVMTALKGHDFDAAMAAITAFPPRLRASTDWQRRGATLESDVLKRRAAYEQGSALLKAAKESWEKDRSADVLSGLYAAFPSEYRETEEGRAICVDFDALRNAAMDEVITSAGSAADAAALKREDEKFKKFTAERQKLEDSANASEQIELAKLGFAQGFEWQIRDAYDPATREPIKGAYVFGDHKLTITNARGDQPILIGKNKRDWNNFTIEFKVRVKKGTQAWFLGRIYGNERSGFEGHYDKLALCNCATDSDKKPHFFAGIPDDQWVRLKYRCLGKGEYDVVVDGKEVYKCRVQASGGGSSGGFAFLVGRGSIEIEELKAKVISRKWDATAGSDDE